MTEMIINFAPTGMLPTREETPHVPLTVEEIVDDVAAACEIGITMVHLHARDRANAAPSLDPDVYAEMIEKIRRNHPGLVVCVSLSGRTGAGLEQRAAPLYLEGVHKPDMASLTLSSLNFNHQASVNDPDTIQSLAATMQERGIVPELEAFDAGMVNMAGYLLRKRRLIPPLYFNLLLGNIACAQPDLLHAGVMLNNLPEGAIWSMAGIGRYQRQVMGLAAAIGGGVRVGLEDNIWEDSARTRLATNTGLLRRAHTLAHVHERTVMAPAALRRLLGLEDGTNGRYGRRSR